MAEVPPGKKGVCFVLREGEEGILRLLESLYPACQTETVRDRQGVPMIFYARIPADPFLVSRGLVMTSASGLHRNCPDFPGDLPKGPFRGSLEGQMFLQQSGIHRFWADATRKTAWKVDGKSFGNKGALFLERGFHDMKVELQTADASKVRLFAEEPEGGLVSLDSSRLTRLPLNRGLEASYFQPQASGPTPVYRQWDPMVNFVSRTDLALFTAPLNVRWRGRVLAPAPGRYDFLVLTEPGDKAQLALDGKILAGPSPSPAASAVLSRGWHKLDLEFQMGGDFLSAVNLAWKKPGDMKYEIIPPQDFGPVEAIPDTAENGANP